MVNLNRQFYMNSSRDLEKKNEQDLVSVIMPAYNAATFIEEAINSVLNQTYRNWELLVVDDCSIDNTSEILKKFNEQRIKCIKNSKNEGVIVSRNKALKIARGKWIAFLDSDDIWEKSKLEKQINFMKDNNYNFSYTKYERVDENGKSLGIICSGPKQVTETKMYNYDYIGILTVMYNKDVIGDFCTKIIKGNDDYIMWLKIIKRSDCFLLDENLAKYRVRKNSISHKSIVKNIKSHYDLYRIGEERSIFISFIFTLRNLFFGVLKKITYEKRTIS